MEDPVGYHTGEAPNVYTVKVRVDKITRIWGLKSHSGPPCTSIELGGGYQLVLGTEGEVVERLSPYIDVKLRKE